MNNITRPRPRRSERLTPIEFADLEKWVKKQPTLLDAHLAIGISAPTLATVRLKGGQGSPNTIAKIRAAIFPNLVTV